MHITIIRHSIRNRGADKLTLDYCAYLVKQGHSVTYCTNDLSTSFRVDPQVEIKNIPFPGAWGTVLFTLFSKIEGDVIIVDLALMACIAWVRNRKKLIYLAQEYDVAYYSSKILQFITDVFYKFALNICRIPVICVSENLREKLLTAYRSENITAVPNGIDLESYYYDPHAKYFKKKSARTAIVIYAREDYRKGLDIAVRALEQLSCIRKTNDWEVWIIGNDQKNFDIAGAQVTNFGFLKEPELRDILSTADIYLSTSRQEGFGLLQLQAMACNCVMIATESLSFIDDGTNGLLSPIEDWGGLAENINRVLESPGLLAELKKNARILAEQYSLEQSSKDFEKALKTITANRGK